MIKRIRVQDLEGPGETAETMLQERFFLTMAPESSPPGVSPLPAYPVRF